MSNDVAYPTSLVEAGEPPRLYFRGSARSELRVAMSSQNVTSEQSWALLSDVMSTERVIGYDRPLVGSDFMVGLTFMESGQWAAIDNLVGEYGEGDTCAAAVHDLIVTLFESRDLLLERRDHLTLPLTRQLNTLNASLRDEML